MRGKRTAGAAPCTGRKSQLQDQQFEEQLRIAEHIVQAFREAGYSCELVDENQLVLRTTVWTLNNSASEFDHHPFLRPAAEKKPRLRRSGRPKSNANAPKHQPAGKVTAAGTQHCRRPTAGLVKSPRCPVRLQHRGASCLVIDVQKFAFSRHPNCPMSGHFQVRALRWP